MDEISKGKGTGGGSLIVFDASGEEVSNKGYSSKVANCLVSNITAKRELQTDLISRLFQDEEPAEDILPTIGFVDEKEKPVKVTSVDIGILSYIAKRVDAILDDYEVKYYTDDLTRTIVERKLEHGESVRLEKAISLDINVVQLAREYYNKSRLGGKQIAVIKNAFLKLSRKNQIFKYANTNEDELSIISSFYSINKRGIIKKNGVEEICNIVRITVDDVFLYRINDYTQGGGYTLLPISIFEMWNETKNNTELYKILFLRLAYMRGIRVKRMKAVVEAKRTELKKAKADKDTINQEIENLENEVLTYKESLSSILERLDTKTYYSGERISLGRLKTDMQRAVNDLKKNGVITSCKITKSASGGDMYNFRLNPNWLTDETARLKADIPLIEE